MANHALYIWELVRTGTYSIPTVTYLSTSRIPQPDLAIALVAASAWIGNHLSGVRHVFTANCVEKWYYVHRYPQSIAGLEAWLLRVLLVDCWTDGRAAIRLARERRIRLNR